MSKKEIPHAPAASDKKMRTKDLIYAGAFGAIYLVLVLVVVMASGLIPILYVISPLTIGIVCGAVYLLCALKVRKFGAVLILGALFAAIACSAAWASMLLAILTALGAELVLFLGKYKSKKTFIASFVVFNLNMACPFLLLATDRDLFLGMAAGYYGQAHADALAAVTPSWIYFAIIGLALAGGLAGGLFGSRLIKKHFEKAGVV
ncbi:MAG: MptD family putative ECF transporter S component [Clostridiales bacterium]|jgi:energy-coupling factor transport system substrate-specific component|nr:MptD family putative ECF transporter S component [Clostridiales bacterium]